MFTQLTELAIAGIVAASIALMARQRGYGIALPLLVAGVVLGLLPIGPDAPPDPEIILICILAPLVFGEALQSSYLDLRQVRRPIMALAVGLVIVTTGAVAYIASSLIASLTLAGAFALGAILAPTDAVAVSAVAKRANLPRRIVSILEGESLVNDGTGLTLLRVAVVVAVAGSTTVGSVTVTFVVAVAGGVLIGLLAGWLLVLVIRRSRDSIAANALVIMAPFPIYLLSEKLHGSGILSIVVAALMVAHAMTSDTSFRGRLQSGHTWRHLTFLLQAFAFMLLGLELPATIGSLNDGERGTLFILVPVLVITLFATRAAFVALMMSTSRRARLGWRQWLIISWAGTRGPVSGMAAFSIPLMIAGGEAFPARELILASTMSVIAITIVLSTTLTPLARRLNLPPDNDADLMAHTSARLARAALARLDALVDDGDRQGHPLPAPVVDALRDAADSRVARTSHALEGDGSSDSHRASQRIAMSMLAAEREELIRLRDEEAIPDSVTRAILADIDAREAALSTWS